MNAICPHCHVNRPLRPTGGPPKFVSAATLRLFARCPECREPFAAEAIISTLREGTLTKAERIARFPAGRRRNEHRASGDPIVTSQGGGCPKCKVGVPVREEDFLEGYTGHSCLSCGHKWKEGEDPTLAIDRDFVERLLEVDDGLTDWEARFIESLSRHVESKPLTGRQREKAEEIANRLNVPVIRAG